jgi:hypothetical protein
MSFWLVLGGFVSAFQNELKLMSTFFRHVPWK